MEQKKYPGNKKYSEEFNQTAVKKDIQKVVSGNVITKSKSPLKKLVGRFLADDADDIKGYVVTDVVIPAIKDAIYDSVTGGLSMSMYGSSSGRRRQAVSSGRAVNYNSISKQRPANRVVSQSSRTHDFEEIICETRADAEEVLDKMLACISEYDSVSINDLYEFIGKTGSFTDVKYGWTELGTAKIRKVREGYLLDLPKAELLD